MEDNYKDLEAKDAQHPKTKHNGGPQAALQKREQPYGCEREPCSRSESPEPLGHSSIATELDVLIDRAKRGLNEPRPKRRHQKIFKFLEQVQEDKAGLEDLADLLEGEDPFEGKKALSRPRLSAPDVSTKEALYKIFQETLTDLMIIKKG